MFYLFHLTGGRTGCIAHPVDAAGGFAAGKIHSGIGYLLFRYSSLGNLHLGAPALLRIHEWGSCWIYQKGLFSDVLYPYCFCHESPFQPENVRAKTSSANQILTGNSFLTHRLYPPPPPYPRPKTNKKNLSTPHLIFNLATEQNSMILFDQHIVWSM